MTADSLPGYPLKGRRQKLDREWMELLRHQEVSQFLPNLPTVPNELKAAIDEFNAGSYWQCHETLEGLWLKEGYPLRLFYHGLIKAAVGLLHAERNNLHGASSKLNDAIEAIQPFLPNFMGVNTDRLLQDIGKHLVAVEDVTGFGQAPAVFIELLGS